MKTVTSIATTKAERLAREAAARRQVTMTAAFYVTAKDLTRTEKSKLAILCKDYDSAANQRAIRTFAAPFYRGDCRQIVAKLATVQGVEEKDRRAIARAAKNAESALFLPCTAYGDLKRIADLYGVNVSKLATERAEPTTDTEPADRVSLGRWLTITR